MEEIPFEFNCNDKQCRNRNICEQNLCVGKVVHEVEMVVVEVESVAFEVESVIENALSDFFEEPVSDEENPTNSFEWKKLGQKTKPILKNERDRNGLSFKVLVVAFATTFLSQNSMAPTLSVIAGDLGFNESERDQYLGAYLALALGVCSVPAAAILGAAADCCSRRRLLVGALLLASVSTLLTAISANYTQLFVARIMAGVAMGGVLPVAFSMVGDLLPVNKRGLASSALTASMGAGVVVGQLLAGALASVAGWRIPHGLLALPSLFAAGLVMHLVREPSRGAQEHQLKFMLESGQTYDERLTWVAFLRVMNSPTNKILIWQGLPGSIPWGVICVFLNDFLSQEKGLTIEQATLVVGMFGFGAALGSVIGGVWGQRILRESYTQLALMMGLSVIGGVIPLLYMLNVDFQMTSFSLISLCTLTSGLLSSMNGANIRALLLNTNVPEARGVVMSAANLVANVGRGVGPLLVQTIMVWTGSGRQAAINWSMAFWGIGGCMLLTVSFTLEDDIRKVQAQLERVASRALLKPEEEITFFKNEQRQGQLTLRTLSDVGDVAGADGALIA